MSVVLVSNPTMPMNNTLEDFAKGVNTGVSLELGQLAIRALVNTATLIISAEVGISAPFSGYRVLATLHGNLRDGVKAEVGGTLAKGSVSFYMDGEAVWAIIKLKFSGPLFPTIDGAFKIISLDVADSPLANPGIKKALTQGGKPPSL
ncbi:hypothetical protein FRC11_011161 [Ceratobasidium sp. 423]|nr:hypothetical protein FRC11_011161 [Ceratobasidium sp. 423]